MKELAASSAPKVLKSDHTLQPNTEQNKMEESLKHLQGLAPFAQKDWRKTVPRVENVSVLINNPEYWNYSQ